MPSLTIQNLGQTEVWSLNRPEARNALNPELVADLRSALEAAELKGTRAVVLTGRGQSFCAGADLGYLLNCADHDVSPRPFLQSICDLTVEMEFSSIVFIAAVHGHAVAGGFELALACDIVIAAENTLIGDGHVANNLVPGGGSSVRIESRIGSGHARWLALSGQLINAEELVPSGWVKAVVGQDSLIDEALRCAEVLGGAAVDAQTRFKQALNGDRSAREAALTQELDVFDEHWHSSDVGDHLSRFLNKKSSTQSR